MKRVTFTILAALALLIPATAAHATEPDTITVYWAMPTPDGGWTAEPTSGTATWPQRHLGTSPDGLACGEWAQADTYRTGPATQALWADGLLTNVGGPEDSGLHAAVSPPWWFVAGPQWQSTDPAAPCFTGPDRPAAETRTDELTPVITCDTYTVETVTYSAEYAWDGTAWVMGEWVETGRASSQRAATDAETAGLDCDDDTVIVPPVAEPPVTEPDAPKASTPAAVAAERVVSPEPSPARVTQNSRETLAETGDDTWVLGFIALGLACSGAGIWHASQKRRER